MTQPQQTASDVVAVAIAKYAAFIAEAASVLPASASDALIDELAAAMKESADTFRRARQVREMAS